MVACKTMLTTLIDIGVPLVERVGRLNEYILHHSSVSQFITFFHAEIDTRAKILRYCNAGHNPPMLLPRDGPVQKLHPVTPPLGIAAVSFETETVRFEPGTKLFMYTDGVTEAANAGGELYEERRLESLLTNHRHQDAGALKDTVMAEVFGFSAGSRQCDDVTLAVVEHTRSAVAPMRTSAHGNTAHGNTAHGNTSPRKYSDHGNTTPTEIRRPVWERDGTTDPSGQYRSVRSSRDRCSPACRTAGASTVPRWPAAPPGRKWKTAPRRTGSP